MKKLMSFAVVCVFSAALAVAVLQPAGAAPVADDGATTAPANAAAHRPDNLPGPLTKQWIEKRRAALEKVARGEARIDANGNVTVDPETNNVVQVAFARTDKVFTVLSEFGTQSSGRYGTDPGPVHNEIAQPDRSVDNSTIWAADFNRAHYEDLFNGSGESMKGFYEQLSSGRYSVTNTVSDWVQVPYNASYYGDNAIEDNGGSWAFIQDTGNAWYQNALQTMTPDEINAYLAQFDVWDRNDYDNDGNYDEPDGYIDHFQAVHAGEGEEAGGRRSRQQGRRRPDRQLELLARRLHHRAGKRRARRLLPRVRTRPGTAGLLRHRGRRKRHRVLDADELGLVAQPWLRGERGHRDDARPDGP